jgi:hypothetical protein
MTIVWETAAADLKRDVLAHGGFLTIRKDTLRERFEIGRLTEGIAQDLLKTFNESGLIVFPNPYESGPFRVYEVQSEIGKVALAVLNPESFPETALVDVVNLHDRATAAKHRRSVNVPWLLALDVFLQVVLARQPEGWEDLDDREPFQLGEALAERLELPREMFHATETKRVAGAVWACRPRVSPWESVPPSLASILAEAARKQKFIFDGMLRDAAKHLLGRAEIPSCNVDLGCIGLRKRRET